MLVAGGNGMVYKWEEYSLGRSGEEGLLDV